MTKANYIKGILELANSMEFNLLNTHQDNLNLSEELIVCERNSPNKPPFAINFLEYYNSSEPVTSWIIRHIFAYTYNGRHPYFESFAKRFLQQLQFNMEWIDTPIINKDHEYKGIDILIRDRQYVIIIENKLKGVDFQLNQLARYIAKMRKEGYSDERIFVIVLPKDNITNDDLRNSVWNLPKDWERPCRSHKCRVNKYTCWCDNEKYQPKTHCKNCESLKPLFENRTLFIHKELSEWLYNCVANNAANIPTDELSKQYVLMSAALQFVDFLNYLYNTRENNKYKMDIQNFLSEQLKLNEYDISEQISLVERKKDNVKELMTQLDQLYWDKINEYITEIGNRHHVHIIRDDRNEYYFYCELNIENKPITFRLDNDGNGDYCQIETKSKRKIPETIMCDFDIIEELNDKENRNDCIWKYDSYKESLLRFDRVLSRLLDIQNSK